MLIIFDLDDTLIDTSGFITPFKLRMCVQKLIDLGLFIPNREEAEKRLLALNAESPRSGDAVLQFLSHYCFREEEVIPVLAELTTPLPHDFVVPTTPNAKKILSLFYTLCPLALVTGGHPPFQIQKMEKAGIEPGLFSKIEIPEDSVKKPVYETLLREFSVMPQDTWVCGDRIAMDLVPAKELGMHTVHMRWGRGRRQQMTQEVDYSICDLGELKGIIR